MSLVLLDNNIPLGVRTALSSHDVRTCPEMGWDALENGELLNQVDLAGFSIMVTADQNLTYQQNLTGRKLALVVLQTNRWDTLRAELDRIVEAVNGIQAGGYVFLPFDRPPLRRRPYKRDAKP